MSLQNFWVADNVRALPLKSIFIRSVFLVKSFKRCFEMQLPERQSAFLLADLWSGKMIN